MLKQKIKDWLKWVGICLIVTLVVGYGWQGLELIFYGEVQHRVVDDIIGVIFMWSILLNIVFIRAIYVPKSEQQKYVVLEKEKFDNLHMKNYEEFYHTLKTLENNCKTAEMIISETIKNENGEESNITKFDSVKSFAQYMKCFNDININYIKKKLDK